MNANGLLRLFDVKNAFCDSMKTLLLSKRNRYFQGLGLVSYIKKLSLKLKHSSRTPNLFRTRSSAGLGILFSFQTPSKRRLGPSRTLPGRLGPGPTFKKIFDGPPKSPKISKSIQNWSLKIQLRSQNQIFDVRTRKKSLLELRLRFFC